MSASLLAGEGELKGSEGRPAYTRQPFAHAAVGDTFERSIALGVTENWHTAMGRTRIGHVQLGLGDGYIHTHNDVKKLLGGGTDYSWTGGGIVGLRVAQGVFAEVVLPVFTGKPPPPDPETGELRTVPHDGRSADGYYRQGPRDLSFNRAELMLRVVGRGGSVGVMRSAPDRLNPQHLCHDGKFPFIGVLGSPQTPRFIFEERRWLIWVEGYPLHGAW